MTFMTTMSTGMNEKVIILHFLTNLHRPPISLHVRAYMNEANELNQRPISPGLQLLISSTAINGKEYNQHGFV